MSFSITRIVLIAAAVATTSLLATGCDSSSGSSGASATATSTASMSEMPGMPGMNHGGSSSVPPARTDFVDADVTFLQMMYPHHAQAVDMAKLVPSRSHDQQLIDLAARIQQAQAPEMQHFADLLSSFGKPTPSATMGHDMPGVMPADQMSALTAATGADFDRMWLQMMIRHHQGAIDMANTELADGTNPDARTLAQNIVTAQQGEIQQMRSMLGQG